MKLDGRGLAVTTNSDAEIHAIDHFAGQLLSLGPDLVAILDAATVFPDCAMIQAYAASIYVYAQSRAQASKASRMVAASSSAATGSDAAARIMAARRPRRSTRFGSQ